MINEIRVWLFGTKRGECEKCGEIKKLKRVKDFEGIYYADTFEPMSFVCEECAKAIKIRRRKENKEYHKRRKEEREKEIKTWIKKRDKILKSEESD